MCDGRAVPSGKVYRQLFDAQVQLSRSLLDGRRHERTDCLSAEDRDTHCSTTSRCLGPLSSRGQQLGADDDVDDVSRLPVAVGVDHSSSDIIERLTEKRSRKHEAAVQQLEAELTELAQVCETQVRAVSLGLLSFLQEVNLRLDSLKDRMEQLDHVEPVSLQEVCALWEEVEEEVKLKKIRIVELNHKLTEVETQRSDEIAVVLRKYCHLLERISFLSPSDICRLIHSEATMLNQCLLANRRSVARLLLLLQEENLQQESLLHLHWEDCLSRWRRSRVNEVIDRFRRLCSREEDQLLLSGQQTVQEVTQTLRDVTERRRDIIYSMCSLVPPSCSPALVSDWFNQLTAVNQQIDGLHASFLHQMRCCSEQTWQDRLTEVKHCEEALSALQLSEEEVKDILSSQLLTLIGRLQAQDEDRLAALDLCCDSAARHALSISRCVFFVMRGAALLWETHRRRLKTREEELQQHLDDLRGSQQKHIQRRKVYLDDLLAGLRQESSEDALKASLDKSVRYLQDLKHSCRQCVSDQWQMLDRLPSLVLEELLSYSSSLSSFFHLSHAYRPSPEELKNLHPTSTSLTNLGPDEEGETHNHPIRSNSEPFRPSQDWLTEAESALLDLCDISCDVAFASSSGVAYSGPAFRCSAPDLPDDRQQETHLTVFPVDLLTLTLSRIRTLFLSHLEQHFHDALSLAVAMVTDRKEAVRLEQELQLQQPNAEHIQMHIYQPRLAELQLHRQRVDVHCEEVSDVLTSCRVELLELQTSIRRKNQELTVTLSNMEEDVHTADSSQCVEALSSTLQDRLDQHIKDTQHSQTSFRQMVQIRLEEVRNKTTQLLNSFRLFSEGGDFAPQEVKMFQRRLKEETKQIIVTEESIYTELEEFESRSLQQVKEASDRFEEKILLLKSEVRFTEKIQKIIGSTQVHIKAEAASSNQQRSAISDRLEELRRMIEDTQVSPDQVCSLLSSVNKDLRRRSQYLDFSLDPAQPSLSAHPESRRQVLSAPPPPVLLQPSRTGVDFLSDPVVDVIKSLNRFCMIQDEAPEEDENIKEAAGPSPVHRLQLRPASSTLSVRRGCRSIRTDRRFQLFGAEPEQISHSFSSSVNSVLWRANDLLLSIAEDFYCSERCGLSRLLLLPDSLDQWADSMQQRLLGYQEQARKLLHTSREELLQQLSVWEELLHLLPSVLISNHERRQEAEHRRVVGGVRLKLEETLAASEKEKRANVRQLRASLRDNELRTINSREELRQQQLHSDICCAHQELQECARVRGEEFVTSLASLTENLLSQLDNFLTSTETKTVPHQHSDDNTVTMETGAAPGQTPCTVGSTADLPSSVTTATASITMNRCTLGHLAVIEHRDAAVKRFEQLLRSELSHSDDDKHTRLRELQSWRTHWRQQIHTLTHTHTDTQTHTLTHTH